MQKSKLPHLRMSLLDLVTILFHVYRGAQLEDEVGFEDCERTLKELTEDLSPVRAKIEKSALESGLWSCNLMSEIGEWWSPRGETFNQFLQRSLQYATEDQKQYHFNKFYNQLSLQSPPRPRTPSQGEALQEKLLDIIDAPQHDGNRRKEEEG